MAAVNQTDIADMQQEVQRLLGRCLLRLQQYERLLKSMISVQQFSGAPETFSHALHARKAEVSSKTLGTLIGRLLTEFIMKNDCEFTDEPLDHPSDAVHFGFRMQLNLPDKLYEDLKTDLRELVTLRNNLVHNFIDLHDLSTVDGCLHAQDALSHSYMKIDSQLEQLNSFAGHMDDAKKATAELIQSPQFRDMVVNGIAPDGQIHWPAAGIVGALREALLELSIDGWVNVDSAARWVSEHYPEQTPRKYGCSRWRHVIHESRQFELRRFTHNEQLGVWFRERSNTTD
ncbi:OST-HTH/LOTUS domain protein [compost metagenome]